MASTTDGNALSGPSLSSQKEGRQLIRWAISRDRFSENSFANFSSLKLEALQYHREIRLITHTPVAELLVYAAASQLTELAWVGTSIFFFQSLA